MTKALFCMIALLRVGFRQRQELALENVKHGSGRYQCETASATIGTITEFLATTGLQIFPRVIKIESIITPRNRVDFMALHCIAIHDTELLKVGV